MPRTRDPRTQRPRQQSTAAGTPRTAAPFRLLIFGHTSLNGGARSKTSLLRLLCVHHGVGILEKTPPCFQCVVANIQALNPPGIPMHCDLVKNLPTSPLQWRMTCSTFVPCRVALFPVDPFLEAEPTFSARSDPFKT